MKLAKLPYHWSFAELADLLSVPESHLRHLFARSHLWPSWWVWRSKCPEPRFPERSLPEWKRLLDQIPVGCFQVPPPPLERPAKTFEASRRGATKKQIEEFLNCLPPKERERLRRTHEHETRLSTAR